MRWRHASVRARTTAGAVLVVALALLVGAVLLVLVVRASLLDGAEGAAEQRADELAAEVARSGPPVAGAEANPADQDDDFDDEADDPEDLLWQVQDASGEVVAQSQPLTTVLPVADDVEIRLPGADAAHLVVATDATWRGAEYDVVVAVSLEDLEDTTDALLPPLLVGVPLLLVVVGATTWLVASRALGPVERIRREVEKITGDRLDRRVPEPTAADEIQRLARTMNQMLARLQAARDRQHHFVADASHELRTPLASLLQTAEVARAHPEALPEGELLDAVFEESARMQVLVEQLLVLARAGERRSDLAPEDVDLDDIVLQEVARTNAGGSTATVAVDARSVGAGRVRGDAVALAQVVRNLMENACRHAASRVVVRLHEGAGGVVFAVEDDGPGIPQTDRDRVFDRFVRLDDARARDAGGSGLGLAIVRAVAASHGGTVAVESATLGGARFIVTLPSPSEPSDPL